MWLVANSKNTKFHSNTATTYILTSDWAYGSTRMQYQLQPLHAANSAAYYINLSLEMSGHTFPNKGALTF